MIDVIPVPPKKQQHKQNDDKSYDKHSMAYHFSVFFCLQEFLSRSDVQRDFSRFLSEESCDVLVLMSLSVGTGDNFTRHLSVYTKQHQYRDMVRGGGGMGEEVVSVGGGEWIVVR